MSEPRFLTREAWLHAAAEELNAIIAEQDFEPVPVRASTGFPSKGGLRNTGRVIGECWTNEASADGVCCIFISPVLDDGIEILGTLLHEQVHAVVGVACKHKGPFRKLAKAVGLVGKMTATAVGEELKPKLEAILERLGPYPQPTFSPPAKEKKQSTRMLKLVADDCCGYTVRTAKLWLLQGRPQCPHGHEMMMAETE